MPNGAQLQLADGIGVACFGDSAIVLDIHRDRYTRVGGGAAQTLLAIHAGNAMAADEPDVVTLVKEGIVTMAASAPDSLPAPGPLLPPEASALEGGDRNLGFAPDVPRIVLACAASRWALKHDPLSQVLRDLPAYRRRQSTRDLVALAREFDRGRRLAPFTPCCLPDALAFVRYARWHGHPVQLVFGVKRNPFEAHSWAQSGRMVLTDPLDLVRRFKPILAL
jgi:hypothetical protein